MCASICVRSLLNGSMYFLFLNVIQLGLPSISMMVVLSVIRVCLLNFRCITSFTTQNLFKSNGSKTAERVSRRFVMKCQQPYAMLRIFLWPIKYKFDEERGMKEKKKIVSSESTVHRG